MKIELTIKKEFDVKFLQVDAAVRYWEDASINGKEDNNDNPEMPCVIGDSWKPLIDLERGKIINWKEGIEADIHYKVCDAGIYSLLDAEKNEVLKKSGYVPCIMYPQGGGYGDYIIMKVEANGDIRYWKADLSDFTEEEDD